MNDADFEALQAHVDEVLASLPIGAMHKAQLRAEMLAHLLEVYDQECARDGDFQRPAEAAIRRFGAARELSDDISADVPWVNRVVFWLIRKKENLMWRLVAFCVLGLALVLVGLGFIMPAVHQLAFQEFAGLSVPLLALGAILALGGVWSFAHGVRRYRMNGA